MIEPFLLRALAAAVGLAVVTAPLGCIVVWGRMAYFGEAIAQASLLGVALGLLLHINVTLAILLVTLACAGLLALLSEQKVVPFDSLLGLLHNGALAAGVIAATLVRGPSVDLVNFLFGDIFAVTTGDLLWILGGGACVLVVVVRLWEPLLRLAVHEELAAAEGLSGKRLRTALVLLLALAIAVAIKIVGILLAIAFLVVPAVAARPVSRTPERMVLFSALVGAAAAAAGIGLSTQLDVPGGPAIVLVLVLIAFALLVLPASAAARVR